MHRRVIPLALAAALACEKPGVAPGLDQNTCDGGQCLAPGVIQGALVYTGAARGDAVVLLFDSASLPPPDGNGTSATAVARIPAATLFPSGSAGPFSAPFVFTQVPAGRSYQIRAFLDVARQFDPFFDFTQQPRAGAAAGGHGDIAVPAGTIVTGINVALTQNIPYDPPSFVIAGGSQTFDVGIDRPARMRLQTTQLQAQNASFAKAHFALEYDLDANGNRKSTYGGLDDVFPRVVLKQIRELDGSPAAHPAIVPCQTISTPVLPAIAALAPGGTPPSLDNLDVFVEPFAVDAADLSPLPSIPKGVYQVVVIEKTGQVWTLPNQLGTEFGVASQTETVTFDSIVARPSNSVSGNVIFSGDPAIKSGNIVVQAFADLPFAPPPPNGAAQPVRVQIIPASRVTKTSNGFTAAYTIAGLPAGNYVVEALDDVDGNFSPLALLQTPSKGDLVGAVVDASLKPASIAVSGNVTGKDVVLAQRIPLDPPAFAVDSATPAQMAADQVTAVRFDLRAQANGFPAGTVTAPHFAVELVRDSGGAVVDADQDGLPDVWPKVFLVRLAASDPTGLTQFVSPDTHQTLTQVIPAAIDPTPFLAALAPQAGGNAPPVVTDKVTVIARPALLDASDPTQPPRRMQSLQPGSFKIVLLERSGQVWQIPNESGSAALDPSAAGLVNTQSQSQAFQVGLPAHPIYSGAIAGTLSATSTPAAAYVFAYAASAPPPFGQPVSADFHVRAEFSGLSVAYQLPDLPTGDYVVVAVADTRGDFAVSPPLFALAPGAGSLLASPQTVHVTTTPAQANVSAATPAPQRPSFQIVASTTPQTSDITVSLAGTRAFQIQPAAVLIDKVVGRNADTTGAFVVACGDATSLSVQLVKVADAAGVVPQLDGTGHPIVAQASVDPSIFTCTGMATVTGPVTVTAPPTMATGRYAVYVTSLAKQVWRVPNEMQPLLQDPVAYSATPADVKTLLQTQQVAVNIAP